MGKIGKSGASIASIALTLALILPLTCGPENSGDPKKGAYSKELLGKTFSRTLAHGKTLYTFSENSIDIDIRLEKNQHKRSIEVVSLDNQGRRIIGRPLPVGANRGAAATEQNAAQFFIVYFWEIGEKGVLKLILPRDNNKATLEEAQKVEFPQPGSFITTEFLPE